MNALIQAKNALDKKDYIKAYDLFVLALEKEDERAVGLQGMAECLYFLRKYDDAIQYANKALSSRPDGPEYSRTHLILSYCYAAKKDFTKSLFEIEKTLVLAPDMIDALSFLSGIYIAQNKLTEAEEVINKIFIIDKNNWLAHYNLGLIRHLEKSYLNATSEYLLAYHLKPSIRPLVRLMETFISQYILGVILISLIFLFISIRFLHLVWMPMLYLGFSILVVFLRFLADRDQKNILIIFIGFLIGYIYFLLVIQ